MKCKNCPAFILMDKERGICDVDYVFTKMYNSCKFGKAETTEIRKSLKEGGIKNE